MPSSQSQSSSEVSRNVPPTRDARVVDDHVRGGRARVDLVGERRHLRAIRRRRRWRTSSVRSPSSRRERVEPRLIDVARGDPRALGGERERGRAADPAARSGDDDDSILEVHAASVSWHAVSREPRALRGRSLALSLG